MTIPRINISKTSLKISICSTSKTNFAKKRKNQEDVLLDTFKEPGICRKPRNNTSVSKLFKLNRGVFLKKYLFSMNDQSSKCNDTLRIKDFPLVCKKALFSQKRANTKTGRDYSPKKSETPTHKIKRNHNKLIKNRNVSRVMSGNNCVPRIGMNKTNIEGENKFKKLFEYRLRSNTKTSPHKIINSSRQKLRRKKLFVSTFVRHS